MTKRELSSHNDIPNCITFRAGTGLLKMVFVTLNPSVFAAEHPVKHEQTPQLRANTAQPQHHGPMLSGRASRFPHRSKPAPAASS